MKLDVIIPVGPSHEKIVEEAIASVQMAVQEGRGIFEEVFIRPIDDLQGLHGRSKARNVGIRTSQSDWLFFLDADDLMYPTALKSFEDYMDYDAVWGMICELKKDNIVPREQVLDIRSFDELVKHNPFQTLQMGFFVKTFAMRQTQFDESMNCGEDWKVFLKLWKHFKCIKQDSPFMINRRGRHSTGPKSATGIQWRESVEKQIRDSIAIKRPSALSQAVSKSLH